MSLRPLTADLLGLDTEAYRASPRGIREHSGGRWPAAETFTAEENAPLIAQHEAEHARCEAFAYAILDPSCPREIGCAYLRPLAGYLARTGVRLADGSAEGAILTYWLVDDEAERPSHGAVLQRLVTWVAHWGVGPVVLRCLPGETATVAVAEALGLTALDAPGSPYSWFEIVQPSASGTARIGAASTSADPG